MKQKKYLTGIVTFACLTVATALIGCAAFDRTKNPDTNEVQPSQAERALNGVMAANRASAPLNPYAPLIAVFGQVAGAFLAGYGGAHVRIKRQSPVDAYLWRRITFSQAVKQKRRRVSLTTAFLFAPIRQAVIATGTDFLLSTSCPCRCA